MSPTTTTRLGLDVAAGTDNVSAYPVADSQAKAILDNSVVVSEGTLASRPLASSFEKNHIFRATDLGRWYITDGSAWNTMLVAGAWTSLTLQTNWISPSAPYTAAARLVGDKVELCGAIQNNVGTTQTNVTIASLPSASYSPAKTISHPAFTTIGATFFGVQILGTSTNLLCSGAVPNGQIIYLDGISYRLV